MVYSLLHGLSQMDILKWLISAIPKHFPMSIPFAAHFIREMEYPSDPQWTRIRPHRPLATKDRMTIKIDMNDQVLPMTIARDATINAVRLCVAVKHRVLPHAVSLRVGANALWFGVTRLRNENVSSGTTITAIITRNSWGNLILLTKKLSLQRQILALLATEPEAHLKAVAETLLGQLHPDTSYAMQCCDENQAMKMLESLAKGPTRTYVCEILSSRLQIGSCSRFFNWIWNKVTGGDIAEDFLQLATVPGSEEYIPPDDGLVEILIGKFMDTNCGFRTLFLKPLRHLLIKHPETRKWIVQLNFLKELILNWNDDGDALLRAVENRRPVYQMLCEMTNEFLQNEMHTKSLFQAFRTIFVMDFEVIPLLSQSRHLLMDAAIPEVLAFHTCVLRSHPGLVMALSYPDVLDRLFEVGSRIQDPLSSAQSLN
jgi:hypothetical protein